MKELSQKLSTASIGKLGEDVAAAYLQRQGHTVVERNYRRKWGESDIITRKNGGIHFVEVKSVSYETERMLKYAVTHETWRPEEQVHALKLRQIRKAAETWMIEKDYTGEVHVDVIAVRLVPRETLAVVNLIENVVIEP